MNTRHDIAARRRREVAVAGHLGDEDRARAGLVDSAPEVRVAALGALARMRRLTPEDLDEAAGDPTPQVRVRAAELAAVVPSAATFGRLAVALGDDNPMVVESACFTAGELAGDASGLVAELASVAGGHADPLCREAAVAALGSIGDPAGLAAILAATKDKPAIRRRAVLALAPFEGAEVDAALAAAASDRDWQVRQAAEDITGR